MCASARRGQASLAADEALARGIVHEVGDPSNLLERAAEIAERYARQPTRALGLTKRLIDRLGEPTLAEQLEAEAQFQTVAASSADHHEGVAALLEKRPPEFTGR